VAGVQRNGSPRDSVMKKEQVVWGVPVLLVSTGVVRVLRWTQGILDPNTGIKGMTIGEQAIIRNRVDTIDESSVLTSGRSSPMPSPMAS